MKKFLSILLVLNFLIVSQGFAEPIVKGSHETLESLLSKVLSAHESIKIARLRIDEAKESYFSASRKQFLSPELEAYFGYRREENGIKGAVSGMNLTQTLFEGGKAGLLKAKARNLIKEEELFSQEGKVSLSYEIKEVFFLYLYYSERKKAEKETLGSIETAKKYTEELYKSGRIPKVKVLESDSLESESRLNYFEAKKWEEYFSATLKELLGVEENSGLSLKKENIYKTFPDLKESFEILQDTSIGLMLSDSQIEKEGLDLKLTQAKQWPKVQAYGSFNHSPRFGSAEEAGLKVSWDFIGMGAGFHDIHEKELKIEEAKARKGLTTRLLRHDIRRLYTELSILEEKRKSLRVMLRSKKHSYNDSSYELQVGTKSFLDLVNPILEFQKANLKLLENELEINLKKSLILKTLGLISFDKTNEEITPLA